MGKGIESAISEGLMDHEEEKTMPYDEKYYETLSEKELLVEYVKQVEDLKQQRKAYADHVEEAEEREATPGSYIGDDKGTLRNLEIIKKILDKQGIPYESYE